MNFAVDFDGTLVSNKYPEIGYPNWDLVNFCKRRQALGDNIILWTCRTGKHLDNAIKYLKDICTFVPDYVNENAPWDPTLYEDESRKIGADYYIDDRAISVYDIDKLEKELNKMDKEFLNADALTIKDNTIASNTSKMKNNIGSNVTTVYHELFSDGWGPYLGKCPHCGSANIEADYSKVLTSMPPQYNCRCKDCKGTFFSGQIKQESQTITPYNPDPGLPNYPDQPQKPQYDWGNTRQGWICPRCGKVNSPDRDFCDCSNNGGWGSPIIWCNSEGTSAGKPNTMPSVTISGLTNDQSITGSIYGFEACNLHEKGDLN